jgi:hypothetical protein
MKTAMVRESPYNRVPDEVRPIAIDSASTLATRYDLHAWRFGAIAVGHVGVDLAHRDQLLERMRCAVGAKSEPEFYPVVLVQNLPEHRGREPATPDFGEHDEETGDEGFRALTWRAAEDASWHYWSSPLHHVSWLGPASEITSATNTDSVISALRRLGLESVAERIAELSRFHEIDPNEPELDVGSLKQMAAAVVQNPRLRAPQLTLSEEGFVHAEWKTIGNGTVAMTFRPEGRIEFAAISEPVQSGVEILRVGGLHHAEVAMNAVQWYTERVAP